MALILLNKTKKLEGSIDICKSGSGVCGRSLRKAQYECGKLLGAEIVSDRNTDSFAVIIMMRSGLPFGLGIADSMEVDKKVGVFFSTKEQPVPPDLCESAFEKMIIVDAVIRTGKGMLDLAKELGTPEKIIFATNVIDKSAKHNFDGKVIYAVRASDNSFVGSNQKTIANNKGPDTGDRLFRSDFYD